MEIPAINVHFTKDEKTELMKIKNGKNWHDFIMFVAREYRKNKGK